MEKEAQAIKWAVGTLYYYLLHNPFHLWVDHEPLKWLETMKDRNARVLCWYLSLLPFSFAVHHSPRAQHRDADYLHCPESWPRKTPPKGVCVAEPSFGPQGTPQRPR